MGRSLRACLQALSQRKQFHTGNRHPLSKELNQKALRKTGQLFVVAAQVRAKLIWCGRGERLCILDHVVFFRLLQAARKFEEPT